MPELTQTPNPHPKTPAIKGPSGACDTHVHLCGPTGKYPFASDTPYEARDALPEMLIALRFVLGLSMPSYGPDMAMLADVLSKYPDRFGGIALMTDNAPDIEFQRQGDLGWRGPLHYCVGRGIPRTGSFNLTKTRVSALEFIDILRSQRLVWLAHQAQKHVADVAKKDHHKFDLS